MRRHFPVFILVLLFADLASLIWLGRFAGVLPVLALVILGIFAGSALIRRSGTNIFTMLSTPASDRKSVSGRAAKSLLWAIAGLLLIIPGIVSDFIALTLLLPWIRKRVAGFFESHISGDFTVHRGGPVIDVEAVEIEETPKLKSNSPLED
ncbi:MAG TPA: FxsA family protein [Aestuariivirga sp.]|nr:FxsA family protein [Aestuariivirga sp.]